MKKLMVDPRCKNCPPELKGDCHTVGKVRKDEICVNFAMWLNVNKVRACPAVEVEVGG